jgi:YVTN family beta-propeller protein
MPHGAAAGYGGDASHGKPFSSAGSATQEAAAAARVRATIPVSSALVVATNPTTNTIYVTNFVGNTVSVINGQTSTVVATIPAGNFSRGWR